MSSSRSLPAKILLWLAVLLMAIAQCVPWERVPLNFWINPHAVQGRTVTKQIDHHWMFLQSTELPPSTKHSVGFGIIRSGTVSPLQPPREIPIYQMEDLHAYARSLLARPPPLARLVSSPWPAMLLLIWPVAFLALLAMPFLTGPLGHSRATLWLVRVLACIMLIWLVRNLHLAFTGTYAPGDYGRIGPGCWLTLASLVLEITALFLVPRPHGNGPAAASSTSPD